MDEQRKQDRRKSRRMAEPLTILVFWNGNSGRHPADMCDISQNGCYLNTSGSAGEGELITLEIPEEIDSDIVFSISGTVIQQERKYVGFGLKFESQTDSQTAFIQSLMSRASEIKDRRTGVDEIPNR